MTSTSETDKPRDRHLDDPQLVFPCCDVASVLRTGNTTGADTFLRNLVRDPGENKVIWDINNSHCSDALMINTAESNRNDVMDNDFLRMHNAQLNSGDEYSIGGEFEVADLGLNEIELYEIDDVVYLVSRAEMVAIFASLIDRGANGGIAGDDMRLICFDKDRRINVQGIDNHQLPQLKIGTFGATVNTQNGPVILIFNQYAYHGKGKTIHSSLQLEDNSVAVDDKSKRMGGSQTLSTTDGYVIPLDFDRGLMYLNLRPFTDDEFRRYPKVIMTRDVPWHPRRYDHKLSDNEDWFTDQGTTDPVHPNYDAFGEYMLSANLHHLTPAILTQLDRSRRERHALQDLNQTYDVNYGESKLSKRDYEKYRLFFLNQPSAVIKQTFNATEQRYNCITAAPRIPHSTRTAHPATNVHRRHEAVATDTVFCNVRAINGGAKCAQLFAGRTTSHMSVHGCDTDADYADCLQDAIRKFGAMDTIISDYAQAEISNRVKDILRVYGIRDWQSEPHHQHQNYAERAYQEVKKFANWVLNWTGAPKDSWLLVMEYVVYILNRTARRKLGWRTPIEALSGQTPDISNLLQFHFWEPCYIKSYGEKGQKFPSNSTEILVYFCGYSEHVGSYYTYKVFNPLTRRVLYRSQLKKIVDEGDKNRSLRTPKGSPDDDDVPQVITSPEAHERRTIGFDPASWIGREFLTPISADGTRTRGTITECMDNFTEALTKDLGQLRFKAKIGEDDIEKLVEYSDMCEFIEDSGKNEDGTWNFNKILEHRTKRGKGRSKKNKTYEVLVEWVSGERSWEPIKTIYHADKHYLAEYAEDNNLIDEWDSKTIKIKQAVKVNRKTFAMIADSKLRANVGGPVFMYGEQVPRNHKEAMELDKKNKNHRWAEAEALEINQLKEYETFQDIGPKGSTPRPAGHKRISLHIIYAVKHDGRYKARAVAGGHMTETPIESVYSSVVSLRGIRMVTFLAELNGLKTWQTDVGNAYLEAETKEKVYVVAGSEFGEQEGNILVIKRALYGLKSSGLRWHERFADVLRDMGFFPCRAEPDIWMRDCGDHYEYIAVYCDDLTIASRNPEAISKTLMDVHKFKLKGTGELKFLLGCDYFRDKDNVLCMAPKKYIEKMIETYTRIFGVKPSGKYQSPLEKDDHPELDMSDELPNDKVKIYQSLIGQCQWIIQLGRFDIAVQIMTLSGFRAAPRQGHLERLMRVYGYLSKFRNGTIRFRAGMPDLSDLQVTHHDWDNSPYRGAKEILPTDLPPPRGNVARLTTYGDANLMHDHLTGKAVTAVLHFINQTPFDWFCKKQSTVETATYGAEGTAARTCIEQMRANKMTLMYLGVPIVGPSVLFGDNKTVVDSGTIPHAKLKKRHLMLSYHYVREAIATGSYVYTFIKGEDNPSDILSKHWSHSATWPNLKPIMFHEGDTITINSEEKTKKKANSTDGRGVLERK